MKILRRLVGQKFKQLFQQFNGDMIVINFGNQIEFSLHIQCFIRVSKANKILLTASDVHFNTEYTQRNDYNQEMSLLDYNINVVNELLSEATVIRVVYNKERDVTIYFDCGIKIEIIMDCLFKEFEYYRFIIYSPHYYDDLAKNKSTHYICKYKCGLFMECKE